MGFRWLSMVTVEPSLLLYMTGSFMNIPLQQQLVYSHYCKLNSECSSHNVSEASCGGARSQVSNQTSQFNLFLTLAAVLPGALTTLALGAWSDGVGRKLVIGLPVAGAAAAAIVSTLVYYLHLDIGVLIFANLMSGILGSFAMFNQATFAYVADVTNPKERTWRLGLLETMIYLGMTLGSELGGVWREYQGFGPPFWGVLACFLLALAYVSLFLPESSIQSSKSTRPGGIVTRENLTRAVNLVVKPGPNRLRMVTILVAFMCAVLNFNGIVDLTIPYVFDDPFRWRPSTLGHFFAVGYVSQGFSALVILRLLLWRGVSDLLCIQLGILSSAAALILLALAQSTTLVFFGKFDLLPAVSV